MKLLIVGRGSNYECGRIIEAAQARGHSAHVLRFSNLRLGAGGLYDAAALGKRLTKEYDTVYFRRFYPYVSEALILAELFALSGGRVIDADLGTGHAIMSKTYEVQQLEAAGLPVPRTVQCFTMEDFRDAVKSFGYPVVLKGVHGGLGRYVYLIKTEARLREIVSTKHRGFWSLQEYLSTDSDIRVLTIGYRAIGAMRRVIPAGDFRANIAVGGRGLHIPLTPDIQDLAERASRALRREFAGVDIIESGGRLYVLEVNQHPGFEAFEAATGIDVAAKFIVYATADLTQPVQSGILKNNF